MDDRNRLKVAVQKSGRLTADSLDLLSKCGLKFTRGKDQLVCFGENMPLDVLFVRDDDILDLVQEGIADWGIVGQNVAEEKRLSFIERGASTLFQELSPLDFGRCRLSIAVPESSTYDGPVSLQGRRIATFAGSTTVKVRRRPSTMSETDSRGTRAVIASTPASATAIGASGDAVASSGSSAAGGVEEHATSANATDKNATDKAATRTMLIDLAWFIPA
jgi:ATP phosphoribosyltransferase